MRFATPLVPGTLRRRYKRFLADVALDDGREVVAHCPNPGAMTGLAEPGMRVWVEPNDDPRRKLGFGWRLSEIGGRLVAIDTALPNRVAGEALRARAVPGLSAYETVRPEVRYGEGSRVDFLLTGAGLPDAYVETKIVHFSPAPGRAAFPDCVTARGAKHLRELARMAAAGHRAVLLYVLTRDDCTAFDVARDIDPGYAAAHDAARAAGVEIQCLTTRIDTTGLRPGPPLALPG
jgi:sugar fermentation stimulation protein A